MTRKTSMSRSRKTAASPGTATIADGRDQRKARAARRGSCRATFIAIAMASSASARCEIRPAPKSNAGSVIRRWCLEEGPRRSTNTKILYRADEVAEAIEAGRTICVAEGEKDCDNLWRIGIPATCNAHGASDDSKKPKWYVAHSEQLRGADLIVLNDNDAPGYAHADTVCKLSLGIAKRVRRLDLKVDWPDIPPKGDVSDWLAVGGEHTAEKLKALIEAAPDYVPADTAKRSRAGPDPSEPSDPPIDEDAELERLARMSECAISSARGRRPPSCSACRELPQDRA